MYMYDEYWMVFVAQVFLQVLIIITGNYNFFNLLTITLCFSLVDDAFFRKSELHIVPYSGKFSLVQNFTEWHVGPSEKIFVVF